MQKKNIIILGMARSGTSLTASIFANHGYYVDEEDDITPKNHNNPKGFWESLGLLKLNENLLRATGFERDNTWRYIEITPQQVQALHEIQAGDEHRDFLKRFEQNAPWVWKDPRLCYTLGIWWPLLDHDNTLAILVRRDPQAIFNSFVRIGWRDNSPSQRKATFERTRQHLQHAEDTLKELSIPYITVQYEEFAAAPAKIAERISEASGADITPADLGYDQRFNHNTLKGKMSGKIDRVANMLPSSWVKFVKHLLPGWLLRKLYPERYQ